MKVGFFEADITPPVGSERAGGYSKLYLHSIHDQLKVSAAVFFNGSQKVALVGVDTCFIDSDAVNAVKEKIFRYCQIKPENIIIGASHTHSGGVITGTVSQAFQKDMTDEVLFLVSERSAAPSPGYREWVINQIVTAITMADSRKEDAFLSVGRGNEDACVFNRRFKMKNGRCYTHPGKCNPDIISPAGPIDPEVGVIGAWRKDGSLIGCIVNYACHCTCNSETCFSADWPFYMRETILKVMGRDVGIVFLNGACGDITQVDNSSHSSDYGFKAARKIGTRVGAEAVKVLTSYEPVESNEIDIKYTMLELKRRKPSQQNIQKSWKILKAAPPDSIETKVIFAKEKVVADALYRINPVVQVPINVIRIGSVVITSNPAEFFAELGLKIKKLSNFEYTFVVSLANGSIGYVPAGESFTESGGGYETVLTGYSNMEINAGDKIAEAALELINQINPEKPNIKPMSTGKPWEYGVLGPDLK